MIRWFQIFVSHNSTFDQEAVQTWIRARSAQTCVQTALVNAQWIDRFLDWLVTEKLLRTTRSQSYVEDLDAG